MKIYLSLAVLSAAIGAWLGAMTPSDSIPAELVRHQSVPQDETVVIRLATFQQAVAQPAGS
jgi:hypothetical protein